MAASTEDLGEVEFEFPAEPVKEAPKSRRKAQTATSTGAAQEGTAQDFADRLEHVIEPVQAPPKGRIGRPPGSRNKRAYTAQEAGVLAPTVVNLANLAAVAWAGPEAVMQAHENALIQPPLERIFARMPAETARKASFVVDPLLIVIGMGMWGARVIQIQAAKKAREKIGTVAEQQERARANGVTGSQYEAPEGEQLPLIDHGAPYVNGQAEPAPATTAPNGGIPDAIRESFGESDEEAISGTE